MKAISKWVVMSYSRHWKSYHLHRWFIFHMTMSLTFFFQDTLRGRKLQILCISHLLGVYFEADPIRSSPRSLAWTTISLAIIQHSVLDHGFSHFDTIMTHDGHTDRHHAVAYTAICICIVCAPHGKNFSLKIWSKIYWLALSNYQ